MGRRRRVREHTVQGEGRRAKVRQGSRAGERARGQAIAAAYYGDDPSVWGGTGSQGLALSWHAVDVHPQAQTRQAASVIRRAYVPTRRGVHGTGGRRRCVCRDTKPSWSIQKQRGRSLPAFPLYAHCNTALAGRFQRCWQHGYSARYSAVAAFVQRPRRGQCAGAPLPGNSCLWVCASAPPAASVVPAGKARQRLPLQPSASTAAKSRLRYDDLAKNDDHDDNRSADHDDTQPRPPTAAHRRPQAGRADFLVRRVPCLSMAPAS